MKPSPVSRTALRVAKLLVNFGRRKVPRTYYPSPAERKRRARVRAQERNALSLEVALDLEEDMRRIEREMAEIEDLGCPIND